MCERWTKAAPGTWQKLRENAERLAPVACISSGCMALQCNNYSRRKQGRVSAHWMAPACFSAPSVRLVRTTWDTVNVNHEAISSLPRQAQPAGFHRAEQKGSCKLSLKNSGSVGSGSDRMSHSSVPAESLLSTTRIAQVVIPHVYATGYPRLLSPSFCRLKCLGLNKSFVAAAAACSARYISAGASAGVISVSGRRQCLPARALLGRPAGLCLGLPSST